LLISRYESALPPILRLFNFDKFMWFGCLRLVFKACFMD
jgi:hypothetical protein